MRAILQGEFHISTSDRETLASRIDPDVDALFVEQREDSFNPNNWSLGYLSFLIGAFSLFWIQEVLYSGPDVQEEFDIPTHNEIDMPLPELYRQFPTALIIGSGLFAGIVFLFGTFIPTVTVPLITVPPTVDYIYTALMKPLQIIAAPLLFSFVLVFYEERFIGGRDENMAESITEISKKNGYQIVVVSCGEAHLNSLSERLEARGWETDVNKSEHSWIAKVWGR